MNDAEHRADDDLGTVAKISMLSLKWEFYCG